ncbi:unnamed protein product [Blepharisma stoltei]|uniref:PH domain-containing protein n=1 Tax=Blepharisma stoltei TaxID=1481888 RepID=A0AAU9IML7_9CILI|nr:unnamed protein product [Blepharisma stoltei]
MEIHTDPVNASLDNIPTASVLSENLWSKKSIIESENSKTPNLIEKSGWLQKKSSHLIKRWQWRFFVLKDHKLLYFHSQTERLPSATINFNQVTINIQVLETKNSPELILIPLNSKRIFHLRASSMDEILPWATAIIQHIEHSKGNLHTLSHISSQKKFWRIARISHQEFLDEASSGDILLFQSKSLPSTIQRKLVGSKYDHVALIINLKGTIMILEATRVLGVNVLVWDEFIDKNWHLLYSKIVYRKLSVENPEKVHDKIAEFCDEVVGKKFRFKLTKRRKKNNGQGQEGFFCSELVAAAYQRIGIMKSDVIPSYFWPSYFADDKKLPLIDCALSQEFIIDFDL